MSYDQSAVALKQQHPHHEHRSRLSFRNVVWAFHSEGQEILIDAATSAAGGKLLWKDAKALGVFLWIRSVEGLVRPPPLSDARPSAR